MLINKDNLSIQQKYSFIEDVKLNKSGNVSESPPIGYGDCATHLKNCSSFGIDEIFHIFELQGEHAL